MTANMVQGAQTGNNMAGQMQQQGQQVPPNAYQPTGVPGNYSILCGQLKRVVVTLNEQGNVLNQQGADKTPLVNSLYKAAYDVNKVCEQLEKDAAGAGQQ